MGHKLIFIGVFGLMFFCKLKAQVSWKTMNYDENYDTTPHVRFRYQEKEGKMTGEFKAYYQNGNLKASGSLENGRLKGEWNVYDIDGTLVIKRYYFTATHYERTFPKFPTKGPAALFSKVTEAPYRDSIGVYAHSDIKEIDVYWKKRFFNWIPNSNENKILFENDLLWTTLWSKISKGQLRVFGDMEFKTRLKNEEIQAIDVNPLKLLGWEIKEVFFFNKLEQRMDVRVLGLRPVFRHHLTQDTIRLFTMYFPDTRSILAAVDVRNYNISPQIKNLDDVFYFRYFSYHVYEISSVRGPSDPQVRFEKSTFSNEEAEYQKLQTIEIDFSTWAYLYSKMITRK